VLKHGTKRQRMQPGCPNSFAMVEPPPSFVDVAVDSAHMPVQVSALHKYAMPGHINNCPAPEVELSANY
jgi:hypothetical protein